MKLPRFCLLAIGLVSVLLRLDAAEKNYVITDFGAVAGGERINTVAIQATIDAAAATGGRVVIPAGVFRSGSIFLKPGVGLHLAAGAVLKGSENIEDYPKQITRIEGHFTEWRVALVNAKGVDGLRITGPGKLDGSGQVYWDAFWARRKINPKCTNLEVERPRLLYIEKSRDVRIQDLVLVNSGFWNIHLYHCSDVLIEGVDISVPPPPVHAPSTDGIDIDSSQRVTVRRTKIAVDDDCIALKGSKGPLADKDTASPPVEDILIEHCEFSGGHGLLTCGSEATLIRRVIVRDCVVSGPVPVVRLKLRPDTPQLYEDLLFENIRGVGATDSVVQIKPWTQFFDLKGLPPPPPRQIRNVVVRHITGDFGAVGIIQGNKGDLIRDFRMENVNITTKRVRFEVSGSVGDGLILKDVVVDGKAVTAPFKQL